MLLLTNKQKKTERDMKLLVNSYKTKAGTTGYNVKVGLMNATGFGLCIGDTLKFKLRYTPRIEDVTWNGSNFKGVSVLAEILGEEPTNIAAAKHPEYGTYSLNLPSASAKYLDEAGAGDCFSISVKQIEIKDKKVLTYDINKIKDEDSIEVSTPIIEIPTDDSLPF